MGEANSEGCGREKLLSPERRRSAVRLALENYRVSERQACRLLGQWRGTQRYEGIARADEDALTQAIIALASEYGRYGYLIGEGNGTVSDTIGSLTNTTDTMTFTFTSNPATETNLGLCPNAGCNITENGRVQNTGLTISWVGTSGTAQDTISFGPDISDVPEPASLILLGSGLGPVGGFLRRRSSDQASA